MLIVKKLPLSSMNISVKQKSFLLNSFFKQITKAFVPGRSYINETLLISLFP